MRRLHSSVFGLVLALTVASVGCGGGEPAPEPAAPEPAAPEPPAPGASAEVATEAAPDPAVDGEAAEGQEPPAASEPVTAAPPVVTSPVLAPPPTSPKTPETGLDALMTVSVGKLAKTVPEARACTTHSDCRTTTLQDGNCCRAGCGPSNAYNATFLSRLEAHQKESCSGSRLGDCTAYGCAAQQYRAVCEQGLCVAKEQRF